MSEFYHFYWVILLVIAAACLMKIGYQLIMKSEESPDSRSSGQTASRNTVSVVPSTQITETGPMVYFANNPHNLSDCEYHFNFKKERDSWRAYILRMPSLRGRNPGLHETHRWTNGEGVYWVCWDTPLKELSDMQAVARFWADCVLEYIATGKSFG